MAASVQVIRDPATAAVLLTQPRMGILQRLEAPDSATGVARQMNLPRQQVNYHLRELERVGLVEFVEERRKGNCMERVLRASARSFVISPEALGELGSTPEQQRDHASMAYLVSLAARAIRELASMRERAEAAGKRIATLALEGEVRFATPADRSAFGEELAEQVARLLAKYHNTSAPEGRSFRIFAGVYPATTKPHSQTTTSVGME